MSGIQIRKATRSQSKLRIGLAGPSGAGKTMSSLKVARGIAGPGGRICMIDTERGSGDLYSHITDYDIITLEAPFAPKNYVAAIEAAEDAGYDVIIVDSLSHAWTDEGGLLDQADKLSKGGNRFTVWADLTPQHRSLVGALLNCDAHVVATVRSKQEYSLDKDEKTGKSTVRKVGMAPVQREGMEYEFTVFMDIDINHSAHTSKDRTDLFKDEVFLIDEAIGERLINWLKAGKVTADAKPTSKQIRINQKKVRIGHQVRKLGFSVDTVSPELRTEAFTAEVKKLTQLDPIDANLDEIIGRLDILIQERASMPPVQSSTTAILTP